MPPLSRSASLRSRVLAGVDKAFAETVELVFLANGKVDPARGSVSIDAVLRVGGGTEANMSGGASSEWRMRLAAGKAELRIDAAKYVGPALRTRDKVRAVARRGQPWFEILRIDDRGDSRLVLELGEV